MSIYKNKIKTFKPFETESEVSESKIHEVPYRFKFFFGSTFPKKLLLEAADILIIHFCIQIKAIVKYNIFLFRANEECLIKDRCTII